MKAAAPESEYVLLKHFARDKGIAYQTLRDAAARHEFDVLLLGRAQDSRRLHVYARREDLRRWIEARTVRKLVAA